MEFPEKSCSMQFPSFALQLNLHSVIRKHSVLVPLPHHLYPNIKAKSHRKARLPHDLFEVNRNMDMSLAIQRSPVNSVSVVWSRHGFSFNLR